jgi:serine phosphatase RsbU (regulator of sigma subunit)
VLAEQIRTDPDTAFTACLLQDIGLLALVYGSPESSGLVGGLLSLPPDERLQREREVFESTHAVTGHALACAWELPVDLARAIGEHHAINGVDADAPALVRVAAVADWMAAVFTSDSTRHAIARTRELGQTLFGLDAACMDRLLSEMGPEMTKAAETLGLRIDDTRSFDELLNHTNLALAEENLGYQELAWRLQRTLDEHESVTRRLRDELEKAKLVQRALLPGRGEDGMFRGINVPARELSGDFFDYFPAAGGRWCFALGDVSGKGMDAALLMSKTSSLFHCLGKVVADPGRLLEALNAELCELSIRGMFVTMIAGVVEPESGCIRIANAGHPPGLLVDRHGRCELLPAGAPPLGVLTDFSFPSEEHTLGQRCLYLYSDGVMEAAAERFPEAPSSPEAVLRAVLQQRETQADAVPARLVHSLVPVGQPLGDDLTVLTLRRP